MAHRLAPVKLYRGMKAEAEAALARLIESYGSMGLEDMIRRNHQVSIELAERWIAELTDPADVEKLSRRSARKPGRPIPPPR